MKTLIIISSIWIIFIPNSFAQSISSHTISSLGGHYNSDQGKLSFTLGEFSITYHNSNTKILSEGFHQSYLDVISDVDHLEEVISFRYYPNPTTGFLILETEGDLNQIKGSLFNVLGQKLSEFPIQPRTEVNMSGLSPGHYYIRITNSKNRFESISIIKT